MDQAGIQQHREHPEVQLLSDECHLEGELHIAEKMGLLTEEKIQVSQTHPKECSTLNYKLTLHQLNQIISRFGTHSDVQAACRLLFDLKAQSGDIFGEI